MVSKPRLTKAGLKNARKFYEELKPGSDNQLAVHADLVRLAKDRGYECTIEELDQALRELWGVKKGEKAAGIPKVYSEPPGF